MNLCPGGCSVFTDKASCEEAGCEWCNGICQAEACVIDCSAFTDKASCEEAGCEWCDGCRQTCVFNWTLTIDSYLVTTEGVPINGSVRVQNTGEANLHNLGLSFINAPPECSIDFSPSSYSKVSPGETKQFTITYTPSKKGNYTFGLNISSDEIYHVATINLIANERSAIPQELLNFLIILWTIVAIIIVLTIASLKLYLRRF